MKKLILCFLYLGLFSFSFMLNANENPGTANAFVEQVAMATFNRIKSEKMAIASDPGLLRVIVEEELMPHVDHTYAALFVLGQHYNKFPKEDVALYVQAFRLYIIKLYAVALGYYKEQIVEFEKGSNGIEDAKMTAIKSWIKQPGNPDLQVIFKVRMNKNGDWKAVDIVTEGVSLLQSKRAEFAPILRQQGIVTLTRMIQEKTNKPLKAKFGK